MYKKTKKFILKTYVVLPVVCLHLAVPEWTAHTHNAHSELEYRMLFPNNEPGNCRMTHLFFPLSWVLDRGRSNPGGGEIFRTRPDRP
jgi:hypothetical protein